MLEQSGFRDPELQYVYGTCNVNGCINEDGSVDPFLFSLDLFKHFLLYCRDLLVFYIVIYVQPSHEIHICIIALIKLEKKFKFSKLNIRD